MGKREKVKSVKCISKTNKGEDCKKSQMYGSKYCFIHQYINNFGKLDKPFWQNSTIHFWFTLLTILVSICMGLVSLFFGATKDNQAKIIRKLNIPAHLAVAELADRSFWENTKGCGDRISYQKLVALRERSEDGEQKKEVQDHINRILDDYKTSILQPRVDAINAVCQVGSMAGDQCEKIEPVKGFSAPNVVSQMDISDYPRCTTRARAVSILRNLDTSPNKDKVDPEKDIIPQLIYILETDPSLLVSKLALDRYQQFTDFSTTDIFDFASAVKRSKMKGEEK